MWPIIFLKIWVFIKVMLGCLKPAILGGTDLVFKGAKIEHHDFIVVGLGTEGDPLATLLAGAGHRTLLMETRPKDITDETTEPSSLDEDITVETTEPGSLDEDITLETTKLGYFEPITLETTDPASLDEQIEAENAAWASFVSNFFDSGNASQALDCNPQYKAPDGRLFIGVDPPQGSKMIGTLHAKTMTLGSCMAHTALITMYQRRQEGSNAITNGMIMGDEAWMRKDLPRLKCTLFEGNETRGQDYKCEKCALGKPKKEVSCDNGIWVLPRPD